jgi:hypothetical protein
MDDNRLRAAAKASLRIQPVCRQADPTPQCVCQCSPKSSGNPT